MKTDRPASEACARCGAHERSIIHEIHDEACTIGYCDTDVCHAFVAADDAGGAQCEVCGSRTCEGTHMKESAPIVGRRSVEVETVGRDGRTYRTRVHLFDLHPVEPAKPPLAVGCRECGHDRIYHADTAVDHPYYPPDAKPEGEPDAYCVTRADGECVSTDPRCIHNAKPEGEAKSARFLRTLASDKGLHPLESLALRAAADEITRLEREVTTLQAELVEAREPIYDQSRDMERIGLEAERDRLAAELRDSEYSREYHLQGFANALGQLEDGPLLVDRVLGTIRKQRVSLTAALAREAVLMEALEQASARLDEAIAMHGGGNTNLAFYGENLDRWLNTVLMFTQPRARDALKATKENQ